MSLFSSLNLARLSLAAHQSAIQTVGQNIANSTTEGYARQRVQFQPTPSNDLVFARLGTGVRVDRIERVVDEHLEATLRGARSDLGMLAERDRVLTLTGSIFNDLNGGGLSQAVGRFFDSLEDLSNTPEDPTARSQVLEEGQTLADTFRYIDDQLRTFRRNLDEDVVGVLRDVNRMIGEVAALNTEIVAAEDGGIHPDTASDLRTRRDALLGELSDIIDIKVIENSRGAVQVLSGSDVLVFESDAREIALEEYSDGDITYTAGRFVDDGKVFNPFGGRLASLLEARDQLTVELQGDLNTLAEAFLDEFNAIHTNGEGTARFTSVTATHAVVDRDESLATAGLPFAVEDGRFTIQVVSESDGVRDSYVFDLDLDGGSDDTSLVDLVDQINAAIATEHPEITASITGDGFFKLDSSDPNLTFTFRDDDSGFLRAAGVNTFFTGTNASNIAVSEALVSNVDYVTTGRGGGPGDNSAAQALLGFRDSGVVGEAAVSVEAYYSATIGRIGVEGAEARDLLTNQQAITEAVRGQREALSGVSLDEEAIELIQYQRAYQGSARFLTVVDQLLDTLINI